MHVFSKLEAFEILSKCNFLRSSNGVICYLSIYSFRTQMHRKSLSIFLSYAARMLKKMLPKCHSHVAQISYLPKKCYLNVHLT